MGSKFALGIIHGTFRETAHDFPGKIIDSNRPNLVKF